MSKIDIPSDQKTAGNVRENSIGWMLKVITTDMDNQMISKLKPLSLSLGQFSIMMTLFENDGLTQREIGEKISVPGYAITRNFDVLETSGYLVRSQHESSRRAYRVNLTEAGKNLAPHLFEIVRSINENALKDLPESSILDLKALLQKMLP